MLLLEFRIGCGHCPAGLLNYHPLYSCCQFGSTVCCFQYRFIHFPLCHFSFVQLHCTHAVIFPSLGWIGTHYGNRLIFCSRISSPFFLRLLIFQCDYHHSIFSSLFFHAGWCVCDVWWLVFASVLCPAYPNDLANCTTWLFFSVASTYL